MDYEHGGKISRTVLAARGYKFGASCCKLLEGNSTGKFIQKLLLGSTAAAPCCSAAAKKEIEQKSRRKARELFKQVCLIYLFLCVPVKLTDT